MNKGKSVFGSKQKSKGQVVIRTLFSLLCVVGVAGLGITQFQESQKITPKKVTNLMLKSSSNGGGLSTSFSIPQ